MRRVCGVIVLAAGVGGGSASAQTWSSRTPSTELGVGIGGVASPFVSATGASIRFGIPLDRGWTIEPFFALAQPQSLEHGLTAAGLYGAQARRTVRRLSGRRHEVFCSVGTFGFFFRQGGSDAPIRNPEGRAGVSRPRDQFHVTPPGLALFGVGAQRVVTPHLAVRADVQTIALLLAPVGVRVSAGLSVPLGRYR